MSQNDNSQVSADNRYSPFSGMFDTVTTTTTTSNTGFVYTLTITIKT